VGTSDAQTLTNKIIDADSNTITDLTDASIKASANIQCIKTDGDFGNKQIVTTNAVRFDEGAFSFSLRAPQAGIYQDTIFDLPVDNGIAGQVLTASSGTQMLWTNVIQSYLQEQHIEIGNASEDRQQVDTTAVGDVEASVVTGLTVKPASIVGIIETYMRYRTDWVTGDGLNKTVVHSLGSEDVQVELYDKDTGETIEVDGVVRTDTNTVDLTATQAPTGSGWRVLIVR